MRYLATFSLGMVALSIACSGSSTGGSLPGQGASSSGAFEGNGDDGGGTSSGATSSGATSSSGSGTGSSGTGSSGAGSSGTGSSGAASSSGTSSGSGSSGGTSSGSDASASYGPYPSGPYCQPAGAFAPNDHVTPPCVLPNMTWIGYDNDTGSVDSYTLPYASYSLDQARKSGKRWAMINVAEFDCPGCQNSAKELATMGASVVEAGGLVIEVLMTSGFTAIATKQNLDYWVDAPGAGNTTWGPLSVTTVKDPDGSSGTPSFTFFGRRDQAYIVDLKTMTITQYIDGSIGPQTLNSAGLAMQALDSKLSGDAGGGG